MRAWFIVAWLAGCASAAGGSAAQIQSVNNEGGSVELAAFSGVVSHTGETRSLEDLKGHPTVVWFFPMAGTPG